MVMGDVPTHISSPSTYWTTISPVDSCRAQPTRFMKILHKILGNLGDESSDSSENEECLEEFGDVVWYSDVSDE